MYVETKSPGYLRLPFHFPFCISDGKENKFGIRHKRDAICNISCGNDDAQMLLVAFRLASIQSALTLQKLATSRAVESQLSLREHRQTGMEKHVRKKKARLFFGSKARRWS